MNSADWGWFGVATPTKSRKRRRRADILEEVMIQREANLNAAADASFNPFSVPSGLLDPNSAKNTSLGAQLMTIARNHEDLARDYRKAARIAGYTEDNGEDEVEPVMVEDEDE